MSRSKAIFLTMSVALLLFNLGSYLALPPTVAIHFGRGGVPDSWLSRGIHVIMITLSMLFLLGGFAVMPRVLARTPARWISIPNSDYWLGGGRREGTVRRASELLYRFGAATAALMLIASVLAVRANLSRPVLLEERIFLAATALYLVYTVWWLVGFYREFRMPGRKRGTGGSPPDDR